MRCLVCILTISDISCCLLYIFVDPNCLLSIKCAINFVCVFILSCKLYAVLNINTEFKIAPNIVICKLSLESIAVIYQRFSFLPSA